MADRITNQLVKTSGAPINLSEVIGRAVQGRSTFGQALNQIKAQELALRTGEKKLDLAERSQNLAEQEFDFKTKKFYQDSGSADQKAFEDRFKFWSEGMSKQDQVKLYDYAKNHQQPVTVSNADSLLSEGVRGLNLKKAPSPQKESMSPIKVHNPNSSTGFSWKVPATGKMIGDAPPTGGLRAKFNAKTGTFEVSTGSDITTKTKGALEEGIVNATDSLVTIKDIKDSFLPEYQTIATRWEAFKTGVQEKVEGIPPLEWVANQFGEGDRQLLRDFTVYKRRAFDNMNTVIQQISGTAVSPAEADRLIRQLPNPGTGFFDGDSPTQFYGKLLDVERSLKRVVARYSYARRNGIDPMAMDLMEIEGIMEERWRDIFKSLPQDQDEVERASETDRRVKEEFGL